MRIQAALIIVIAQGLAGCITLGAFVLAADGAFVFATGQSYRGDPRHLQGRGVGIRDVGSARFRG